MKINVQLDFKTIQARSAKPVHLVIELGAARLETQRTEPIAFCVVLDRSNSMDGEPIRNAREACKLLVRNLRANDLFSLVTFSDSAQVVIPMGTVKNLDKVLASIDQIQARGYTNLTGGWSGAGEELELTPKNVKRRLLLLTDGQANVGITNPAIIQNVVSLGAHGQNIRTSTIGFGLEYQEELLSEMATVSSGQFYNADKAEKLASIFSEELEGLQAIVSQNVRVQLTPLDVCAGWTQMSNYPAIARDGDVTELSIGDLRSEEDRIAVLELDVLQLPFIFDTLNGESLFKVKVLWDEITNLETKSCEYEQIVQISATQNEADIKINESTIRWVAVQQAAEALKTATNSVKMNNTRKAVETLMTTMKTLEDYGVPGKTQDGLDILQEFLDRLKAEQGFSSQSRKDAHETTAFLGRLSTTRRLASTTRFSPRFTKKLSKLLPSQ